jgi:hypothetical protein
VSTENLLVPTTAWQTRIVPRPRPMFAPGETSPSWLGGIDEVPLLVTAAEGLLVPLYLAGYDVDEILIGEGDDAASYIVLEVAAMRLRQGTTTWEAHTGAPHPRSGDRSLAIHAAPLPYDLAAFADQSVPLAMDLRLTGVQPNPFTGGWLVVGAEQQSDVWADTHRIRDEMLDQLADVWATIHGDPIDVPAGLLGILDPSNWHTIDAGVTPSPYEELINALTELGYQSTLGRLVGSDGVVTEDEARAFLESEVPAGERRQVWRNWRDLTLGRRISMAEALDDLGLDEAERNAAVGHLATLQRHGLDGDRQSLLMAILHLHERHIINAIGGYSDDVTSDACTRALAYADPSFAGPLTPEQIGEMCECLGRGITETSHVVATRLVAEYPGLLDDEPTRTLIRDTLITSCYVADSCNGTLNSTGIAQGDYRSSAEYFADLVRDMLASAPLDPDQTIDPSRVSNHAIEAHDCWSRWSTMLEPADTLNRTPLGYKMHALIPIAFHDCGNAEVARLAAQSVERWYWPKLLDLWDERHHHWARPEMRGDFAAPYGSTLDGVQGWSEDLLVKLLEMLRINTPWADIPTLQQDGLFLLAGFDPLMLFPIEDFEKDYAELVAESPDPLVQEYSLLLSLLSDYAHAADESTAGRYDARRIGERIGELDEAGAPAALEALREPAFEVLAGHLPIEYRTIAAWEAAIRTSIQTTAFRAFVGLLDAESRIVVEADFVGRCRRVCPAVGLEVVGAFRAVDSAFSSPNLVAGASAMTEDELTAAFEEVCKAVGLPSTNLPRQLAKTMKESFKIADTWLSATQTALDKGLNERLDYNHAATAAIRSLVWPTAQSRPSDIQVRHFLDDFYRNKALADELNAELSAVRESYPDRITAAKELGNLMSLVTAGVVVYQLTQEKIGSAPTVLSQVRDVVVGAGATAWLGYRALGVLVGDADYFTNVLAAIKAGNDFLSAFSGWVSLATNAYQGYVYWLDGDWVGMLLYTSAATASGIVLLAAVGAIEVSVITAVAGFIAAAVVLIDVARLYVLRWLAAAEYRRQFLTYAAGPGLFFAPTVALRVPQEGSYQITRAYATDDVVGELGLLTPDPAGAQGDPTPEFTVDEGVSRVDLAATGAEPLILASPHALVASAPIVPAVFGEVAAGETVHEVRPAFEWWRELSTADPDQAQVAVSVEQDVVAGAELATAGGTTIFAPGTGQVGSIEHRADLGLLRIRIYRGIEP